MTHSRLKVDFGVWCTVRKVSMLILTIGFGVALSAVYIPIIRQRLALQGAIEKERRELRKKRELNGLYLEEISDLKSNSEAVEHLIREKSRLIKTDETVYRFESSSKR